MIDTQQDRRPASHPPDAGREALLWAVILGLSALAWAGVIGVMVMASRLAPPPLLEVVAPDPPLVEETAAAPGEPPAAERSADGVLSRAPSWRRTPTPEYPTAAMRQGVEQGTVVLTCEAMAEGVLGACEVIRETPAGAGFAEAALESTRQARMAPRQLDGAAVDSRVTFTVRFQMEP